MLQNAYQVISDSAPYPSRYLPLWGCAWSLTIGLEKFQIICLAPLFTFAFRSTFLNLLQPWSIVSIHFSKPLWIIKTDECDRKIVFIGWNVSEKRWIYIENWGMIGKSWVKNWVLNNWWLLFMPSSQTIGY